MNKFTIYQALLFTMLSLTSVIASGWDHSIQIGYGRSNDPNHNEYTNSGVLLTSDLYVFRRTPLTRWSFTGALGQWYTTTPINKHLTTAAISVALRLYPFTIANKYPAYFLGSVGPAWISNNKFGRNTQAANLTGQWNLGLGAEFNHIDVNLRWAHFSNAYIARPDQGFSILYLLSIGYLF